MLPHERARRNAALFDRLAPSYDTLGFLTLAAQVFAAHVPVRTGDAVLEVAAGTGTVALALATRVGPGGEVVATDLAPQMVAWGQRRARAESSAPVRFEVADAGALPFPQARFDRVVCASGLFFMPDMTGALREWRRVLQPGGTVAFSSFGRGLLGELPGLWRETLAGAGLQPGSPPLGRIPSPEAARALLDEAGFEPTEVTRLDLSYTLPSPEARWADIEAGLEGAPLHDLGPGPKEAWRDAHLAQLRAAFSWPLTVPVPLIVASGRR
ncbi:class I SAM-dependent methyltransferase [Deinococcus hohokamensis]|uniref:Class I SAM-dependent methyltransferase n=1 Tax=Deinococcus hohokamensis TaxID=309883 RepID=A0ABV9IC40_9DEIO